MFSKSNSAHAHPLYCTGIDACKLMQVQSSSKTGERPKRSCMLLPNPCKKKIAFDGKSLLSDFLTRLFKGRSNCIGSLIFGLQIFLSFSEMPVYSDQVPFSLT